LPAQQFLLECLPEISRRAKKNNHEPRNELRLASARTVFR
jgi:hypothetical protein